MFMYNVEKVNDKWGVYETATEHYVDFYATKQEAVKKSKFWSKGGSFHGWTPSFVARKVS